MSTISPSLHIRFNVNLPGSQARSPHARDLPRIDPRVLFGSGGETDICKNIHDRLAVSRCRLTVATIYAQRGNNLKALEWLETALRLRDPGLISLKTDPLMDPIRQEPRFQAAMRELKFPT